MKNQSLRITIWHHSASLVMPNCDPKDRFFYPPDIHNRFLHYLIGCRGGSRISGKGVHMQGVRGVALLILSHFLKYPMKMNNLVSLRPNYFIVTGYLKTVGGKEGSSEPPETLWFRQWARQYLLPECSSCSFFTSIRSSSGSSRGCTITDPFLLCTELGLDECLGLVCVLAIPEVSAHTSSWELSFFDLSFPVGLACGMDNCDVFACI